MKAIGSQDENPLELERLLEEIYRRYHYDFRQYARSSLARLIARAQSALGSPTLRELIARIIREPAAFSLLLRHLTVQVSDLFRDPDYHRMLRERVMPNLATYPSPKIWVAGCGTGEEAYSIAILLQEQGLLDRSLIYATDIDAASLGAAAAGTYALERMSGFSENYLRAGGRSVLSDYCTTAHSRVTFNPSLRKHVMFADHSLATDASFAEVQLVSCRNVLIYFDQELQQRAMGLFHDSLCRRGFLGLGSQEALPCSGYAAAFDRFAGAARIYRLR